MFDIQSVLPDGSIIMPCLGIIGRIEPEFENASSAPDSSPVNFIQFDPLPVQPHAIKMNPLPVTANPDKHPSKTFSQGLKVLRFKNLDGDDFRHPLDKQNTALLRRLPGLEMVAKTIIGGPGFEQALYLENIGAALRVGPQQLPTINNLLLDACSCLNMEPPALYIRQVRFTDTLCGSSALMQQTILGAPGLPTATKPNVVTLSRAYTAHCSQGDQSNKTYKRPQRARATNRSQTVVC
jgi:hypothetical protein